MNNFTLKGLRIRNLSKSWCFFPVVYRRLETSHRRLFRFLLTAQLPITPGDIGSRSEKNLLKPSPFNCPDFPDVRIT